MATSGVGRSSRYQRARAIREFAERKSRILSGLMTEEGSRDFTPSSTKTTTTSTSVEPHKDVKPDRSLKMSVDAPLQSTVGLLNSDSRWVSTSCCSGRVSIFYEDRQSITKTGLTPTEVTAEDNSTGMSLAKKNEEETEGERGGVSSRPPLRQVKRGEPHTEPRLRRRLRRQGGAATAVRRRGAAPRRAPLASGAAGASGGDGRRGGRRRQWRQGVAVAGRGGHCATREVVRTAFVASHCRRQMRAGQSVMGDARRAGTSDFVFCRYGS
eukprot:Selendium_serpulae@DN1366_c0_g1_i1.p1